MRTIYISGNLNKIFLKICAFRFLTSGDDFWRSNAGRNIWPVGFECLWLLLATVHYLKAFFRNSSQVIWGLDIYSNKDICFSKPQWAGFLSKSDRWAQRQIKKRTKKKKPQTWLMFHLLLYPKQSVFVSLYFHLNNYNSESFISDKSETIVKAYPPTLKLTVSNHRLVQFPSYFSCL